MRNRKKKKRRHPRSTKYNLRTDEERHPAFDLAKCDGKPELSSRTKSGYEFQQSGKILQLQ
jgi:hypothetical protein